MLNSPLQKDAQSCAFINSEGLGILSSYLRQCINLRSLAGEQGPEIESREASGTLRISSRFTELCLEDSARASKGLTRASKL